MTRDDQVCLALGREVVRMIHDVRKVAGPDVGYARRTFSYPGGAVEVFIANGKALADLFEKVASGHYDMQTATPPSEIV